MVAKLAQKMTQYFIKKKVIKEEEKDTYDYCFEVLVATVINLVILVVLGILTKRYIETALFCTLFMFLRGAAGGYHANTHAGCLLTLLIVYGILLSTLLINIRILFYVSILLFAIAIIIFIILAPVDNKNKILEITEKKRLKKRLVLILSIITVIFTALMFFKSSYIYAYTISYIMFSVAILVLLGNIKNIIGR
ncbi:MAG: accessory gene regulator B family protein [Eubacteriales bacterium]|nr:accessory gene regulator B family protein [Eubacteriales bacterium]